MISQQEQTATQALDIPRIVKEILIREARVNIDPGELSDDEPLNSDTLRINSLAFVGIILCFEDALDITLDEELFMKSKFTTVVDLITFIEQIYCRTHKGN
jgi:acyl carrier protein